MVFRTGNGISIQLLSLCWKEKSDNHKAQSMSSSHNNVLLTTSDENYMEREVFIRGGVLIRGGLLIRVGVIIREGVLIRGVLLREGLLI